MEIAGAITVLRLQQKIERLLQRNGLNVADPFKNPITCLRRSIVRSVMSSVMTNMAAMPYDCHTGTRTSWRYYSETKE